MMQEAALTSFALYDLYRTNTYSSRPKISARN